MKTDLISQHQRLKIQSEDKIISYSLLDLFLFFDALVFLS